MCPVKHGAQYGMGRGSVKTVTSFSPEPSRPISSLVIHEQSKYAGGVPIKE